MLSNFVFPNLQGASADECVTIALDLAPEDLNQLSELMESFNTCKHANNVKAEQAQRVTEFAKQQLQRMRSTVRNIHFSNFTN